MAKIPLLRVIVERYVRGCTRAYLEGGQSLRWVIGCITRSGLSPREANWVISQLRGHGSVGAWCALQRGLTAATEIEPVVTR